MRNWTFDTSTAQGLPATITIQRGDLNIQIETFDDSNLGYTAWPGADITGLQFPSDCTPSNADVVLMAIPGSSIEPGDGARGLLDNWPITIQIYDPGPNGGSTLVLSGIIGSVEEDTNGMLTIAANGLLRLAAERSILEKYSLTGRESLGDDRCKVPLCVERDIYGYDIQPYRSFVRPDYRDGTTGLMRVRDAYGRVRADPPTYTVEDYGNVYYECTQPGNTTYPPPTFPTTVGLSVTDGTAVFICRNAWTRYARGQALDEYHIQFTALPDPRASDATWYAFGGLFIRSGDYSGFPVLGINAWDPDTLTATLFLPIVADSIPADTQFEIHPGCDLTHEQCFDRFDNIINGRMEFLVPPPDTITGS